MDLATILWLDSKAEDDYWETCYRRGDPERDWDGSSDNVSPDLDDQEDAWNDTRRRERLDEAEYDC